MKVHRPSSMSIQEGHISLGRSWETTLEGLREVRIGRSHIKKGGGV
jgi:hypothetical protein